jgi:hypothetical protein
MIRVTGGNKYALTISWQTTNRRMATIHHYCDVTSPLRKSRQSNRNRHILKSSDLLLNTACAELARHSNDDIAHLIVQTTNQAWNKLRAHQSTMVVKPLMDCQFCLPNAREEDGRATYSGGRPVYCLDAAPIQSEIEGHHSQQHCAMGRIMFPVRLPSQSWKAVIAISLFRFQRADKLPKPARQLPGMQTSFEIWCLRRQSRPG